VFSYLNSKSVIVIELVDCEQIILNPNLMNVYLPFRNFILYLVFSIIPVFASAQTEYREVLVNDSLYFYFVSEVTAPQVSTPPLHGDFILNNGTLNYPLGLVGENELVYIPDVDYIGSDLIKIIYYTDGPVGPTQNFLTLNIDVVESYVEAKNDFASTLPNVEVTIDVLDNDLSSGELIIADIPLVNNGIAEVTGNSITFTPNIYFQGIANFTYTVCDEDFNKCDVATINVFVKPEDAIIDTTTITVLKNSSARALFSVSDGIQELSAPQNGTLELMEGGVIYTPDLDFVGKDTFTYAYDINTTTSLATFVIDVKWVEDPNILVVNDFEYSAINDSATFNVLDNDQDGLFILNYSQSDEGGEVFHTGGGNFLYVAPDNEFEGLDFFEYTAFIPGTSTEETGTVYIAVNNQKPASIAYDLYTPKNTPLVINYDIPIDNFDFTILSQSQYGALQYYPGDTTIEVNNQVVEGYNLLIYYPDTDFLGDDLFEIQYCVETDCRDVEISLTVQEIVAPQSDTLCVIDCTWPGDANGDGKVNMIDLLPLGYCVGELGVARDSGSIEWYGQYGEDWSCTIGSTGENAKHADTNGDGYISALDTVAIGQSYGKYSSLTREAQPVVSQIPLFFVPKTPNPEPGDKVLIDIVLGTENLPALDIHGITFALNFNPDIVEEGTMEVVYNTNNWLSYESAMISMMKEPALGRVESGYTRATGISNHGYGIIGQVSYIVVDDIIDGTRVRDTLTRTFRPENLVSMNAAGQYYELVSQNFDIKIAHNLKDEFDNNNDLLIAYPNPTTGNLNIHVNGNNELEQVIVHSITGQEVYRTHDSLSGKATSISFNDRIANGIYLVTAICDKGVYTKKIELVR
jgi:type IX secretion system substrate protein/Big-like domain-containing protein/dockerin type I repeat protein